jgi:hypothetical protein
MSDLDNKLAAALNADPPPARDPKFRVEVLMRIESARFRRRVMTTLAVAFAAAAVVAVNAQAIGAWIAADIWRLGIVGIAAIVAMFSLSGVPIGALPGLRSLTRVVGRWLYP